MYSGFWFQPFLKAPLQLCPYFLDCLCIFMKSSLVEEVSVPCSPESPRELSSTLARRLSQAQEHHPACSSIPGLESPTPHNLSQWHLVKSLSSEESMQVPELRQGRTRWFPPTALRGWELQSSQEWEDGGNGRPRDHVVEMPGRGPGGSRARL